MGAQNSITYSIGKYQGLQGIQIKRSLWCSLLVDRKSDRERRIEQSSICFHVCTNSHTNSSQAWWWLDPYSIYLYCSVRIGFWWRVQSCSGKGCLPKAINQNIFKVSRWTVMHSRYGMHFLTYKSNLQDWKITTVCFMKADGSYTVASRFLVDLGSSSNNKLRLNLMLYWIEGLAGWQQSLALKGWVRESDPSSRLKYLEGSLRSLLEGRTDRAEYH